MRNAPVEDGALTGQVHELGVLAAMEDGLCPLRDLSKRSLEINFLKGSGTQYLCVHLAGQGQNRCAIDVGVP